MANEVDFVPFAIGEGANVETQAEYLEDPALSTGFQVGIANPQSANKALRQGTVMAAAIANFISTALNISVLDDGDVSELEGNFANAIAAIASAITTNQLYADDTGAANAYVIAPDPALGAYSEGVKVRFKAANANTGASTIAVSGLAAKNLVHVDGTALPANAIVAAGEYEATYDGAKFMLLDRPVGIALSEMATIAAGTVLANTTEGAAVPSPVAFAAFLTAIGALVESGSFATPGTIQIGSLIINVGTYSCGSGGASTTVTFNESFPNGFWFPIISVQNAAAGQLGYSTPESTGMTISTATEDESDRSGLYAAFGH